MLEYKEVLKMILEQLTKEPYNEDVDMFYIEQGVTITAISKLKELGYVVYVHSEIKNGISPVIVILVSKGNEKKLDDIVKNRYPNFAIA